MFIYDAALKYREQGVPLIVIAGREYGGGSSRDWAAKGPALLGVKAVIAETYERIHRTNLIGMGILPLQFKPGQSASSLGLTGREEFDVIGLADGLRSGQTVKLRVRDDSGERMIEVICRLDGPVETRLLPPGRHHAGGASEARLSDLSTWIGRARSIGQSAPVAIALLLLANLLPLAGVLFFGWDVGMVLITYWLENGIVGLINVPKILLARGKVTTLARLAVWQHRLRGFLPGPLRDLLDRYTACSCSSITRREISTTVTDPLSMVLASPGTAAGGLTLLVSHGASFFVNYIGRGEYLRATPDSQMLAPYGRMFVLHIAIVLGGAFVIWQGEPLFAVVLLVVLRPCSTCSFISESTAQGRRSGHKRPERHGDDARRIGVREAAVIDRITPKPAHERLQQLVVAAEPAAWLSVVVGYRAPEPAAAGVVAKVPQPGITLDVDDPRVALAMS